ncbi:MAG TPA: Rad52/Rad22 family DNA repair protein [Gemmataceae bacterium]|nr:Rad52/Rad22 family DNA repair protein [Gemmataceae bacterium]
MKTSEMPDIQAQLAAPFDPSEVKFKPAVVKGNRALALCYVDARTIMDRLDNVVGVDGWSDEYEFLPDGSCLCKLRVRFGDEWITKMDVGGESEQSDEGDRHKAAVSDALKRVAVKFGVGRYLYRLPSQWVDYEPQKKQLLGKPGLPAPARVAPATNGTLRKQLVALIESTGTALPALLRHYGAETVDKLSDEQANDAIRRLKAKLTPSAKQSA